MAKVKYFVLYSGPSFGGGYDNEFMAGVSSLVDAREYFSDFYFGSVTFDQYRCNDDRYYVQWSKGETSWTPGTTHRDYMDVHEAIEIEPGVYECGDSVWRYSFTERGAVTREKF